MVRVTDYLRKKKLPHIWCSGCGDGTIMGALIRAIASLNYSKDEITMVTGIGCSARTNAIADFNTFQTTHGRALSFATGYKMVMPGQKVIVVTGDGDGAAIGGNHLLHTARRNIDITTILINNSIYGMTGGQHSPMTPIQARATSAPFGNVEEPVDVCKLAEASGATYVARGTVYHHTLTERLIKDALQHQGFSFVEVISQCPVGYGRRNNMGSAIDMLYWQRDNSINVKAAAGKTPEEIAGKFLIGELVRRTDREEFCQRYNKMVANLAQGGK
jgi:2-oxoglutarate ferredoxin oxidoreductase subunit beta